MEFFIDRLNRDLVEGWVFPSNGIQIDVFVDDSLVGAAERRLPRPDVAAANPTWPQDDAGNGGFRFVFPKSLFHKAMNTVRLRFLPSSGTPVETADFIVPNISRELISQLESDTAGFFPAPFPSEIMRLLHTLRGGAYYRGPWDDELLAEAVSDLQFLLLRGTKHLPAIFRYLIYLKRLWQTFTVLRENFPKVAA
jgi:hypothetical protein